MSGPEYAPLGREPALVARWDLDKTYLRTEFDTLGELLSTALERPDQKRAVPGANTLLRELHEAHAWIHILSGSPRQMRSSLEEKLRIDGVWWDELTLKPNLSNLFRLRLRALRDQLGYKLPMLLEAHQRDRARLPGTPWAEVLVGDDVEADAFIYSLYADLCAGQLSTKELTRILKAGKLYEDQATRILTAQRTLGATVGRQRIFIHLDRQSPPSRFDAFGPRVVPFYNYLQVAFVLLEDALLGADATLRIATRFVRRHHFDEDALARSYKDLMRRGHVDGSALRPLRAALERLSEPEPAVLALPERIAGYVAQPPEPTRRLPRPLDYVALARRHRGGRNRGARG